MTETTKNTICMWAVMGVLLLQSIAAAPMREPDSLVLPVLGSLHEQEMATRASERIDVPMSEMAPAFTGMMPDELSMWMQQKSVRDAETEQENEQETEQFEFTGMQPEQMSAWVEQQLQLQQTEIREAPSNDEQDAASISELEQSIAELQTAEFISDI
ncbi:hypothetical protein FB639_003049, partial [Coemansia asiatica]